MHIPLIVKTLLHPKELPNNYNDRLVTRIFPNHDPVMRYMKRYLMEDNWYGGEFAVTRDGRLTCSHGTRFSVFSEQLENTDPKHRWEEANRIAMHVAALIVQDILRYCKIVGSTQEELTCLPDTLFVTYRSEEGGIPVIKQEMIPNHPGQVIHFIMNRLASDELEVDEETDSAIRSALDLLEALSTRGRYPFLDHVGGLFAWHIIDATYKRKRSSKHIEAIYLIDMHV
jgi:hypothetical protein